MVYIWTHKKQNWKISTVFFHFLWVKTSKIIIFVFVYIFSLITSTRQDQITSTVRSLAGQPYPPCMCLFRLSNFCIWASLVSVVWTKCTSGVLKFWTCCLLLAVVRVILCQLCSPIYLYCSPVLSFWCYISHGHKSARFGMPQNQVQPTIFSFKNVLYQVRNMAIVIL